MDNEQFVFQAAKVLIYSGLSFVLAMWWAPVLIQLLHKFKFWKKADRKRATSGEVLTVTKQFYEENERQRLVPRAGGLLVSVTVVAIALVFWLLLKTDYANDLYQFLNFVDRRETFIPLGTLVFASILGFADDFLSVMPKGGNYFAGGLKLSQRLVGVVVMSLAIGVWFHTKIGDKMHTLTLPWYNGAGNSWYKLNLENINLPFTFVDNFFDNVFGWETSFASGGWLIILITVFVLLAVWGTSVIDGFDGLAAGVTIPVYLCFAGLAFAQEAYDIATFLMVVTGALTAYLWFNIPPAKFYLGDTGAIGLLLTLGTVAMLLDKIYVLPIAGFILFVTLGSVVIQLLSKKIFKKKVFLAAPLHHHLEAKGWLRHQVTMRYWLISIVTSVLGFAFGLIVS